MIAALETNENITYIDVDTNPISKSHRIKLQEIAEKNLKLMQSFLATVTHAVASDDALDEMMATIDEKALPVSYHRASLIAMMEAAGKEDSETKRNRHMALMQRLATQQGVFNGEVLLKALRIDQADILQAIGMHGEYQEACDAGEGVGMTYRR